MAAVMERSWNIFPPHDPSNLLASLCPAVKHPPAAPSRFISVPTKTPDKMDFDEVDQAFWGGGEEGGVWGLEGPMGTLCLRSL